MINHNLRQFCLNVLHKGMKGQLLLNDGAFAEEGFRMIFAGFDGDRLGQFHLFNSDALNKVKPLVLYPF